MRMAFWLLIAVPILALTGCAQLLSPGVQQAVSDARAHLEVVKSLEVEEKYPDDVKLAKDKLSEAEGFLAQTRGQDKALEPATASFTASQRIIKTFYGTTITPLARKAKEAIDRIAQEDPDNPLKELRPKLEGILNYSTGVEGGGTPIALGRVFSDLEEILTIKHNVDDNDKATFASDVTFATGEYELTREGEDALRQWFEGIVTKQKKYMGENRGKSLSLKMTVIGYTDEQDFRRGSKLWNTLMRDVNEAELPKNPRPFLNQRLSRLRAEAIGNRIRRIVEETDNAIRFEKAVVGRGEELPPGAVAGSRVDDPQRRICKVYSYAIVN